ncbi:MULTISPECIES: DUF2179 domain-containing protein [Paenibacillus]|uniref:DUF2179 domain-containing protein n=1 Tax=Paenibacillus TaxID=44249 RepID=UPI00020D6DA6|nr:MULTISPECIES: DUF2179 domain-containing protein [Paenibacillus]EGL16386.1 hypothetical protein HMPREF9413_1664 [Paenibacillus sp. HGF7]EPD83885.1 hypothetical protein HMPREF1207_03254 [Paenibacillus sp. HGH0039]MBV6715977.1 DUF2179 domain-containing protein [Paenibacillus chitinolyticus]
MISAQTILTIIVINIAYVSLSTIRMILVMKARRLLAASISTVEIFIYLMGLNIVLKNIDDPVNIIAYCVGWGAGVWLGIRIEGWLALGYTTLQIVVDYTETTLPDTLRNKGYGVTHWVAEGRDGPRLVMQVLAKRSLEKKLLSTLHELAPKAFVISYEPRFFRGGFWTRRLNP